MRFRDTEIAGVVVVEMEPVTDHRGAFARVFCSDEFAKRGLPSVFPQTSVSTNRMARTLRGLHYQVPPHEEGKLVRCARGALFDVAVDLRRDSPTRGRAFSIELTAEGTRALYIPPGCAHGFLTLRDDTEVVYQISVPYQPSAASGVRWDDPTLAIPWPATPSVISERDRALPLLHEVHA